MCIRKFGNSLNLSHQFFRRSERSDSREVKFYRKLCGFEPQQKTSHVVA